METRENTRRRQRTRMRDIGGETNGEEREKRNVLDGKSGETRKNTME